MILRCDREDIYERKNDNQINLMLEIRLKATDHITFIQYIILSLFILQIINIFQTNIQLSAQKQSQNSNYQQDNRYEPLQAFTIGIQNISKNFKQYKICHVNSLIILFLFLIKTQSFMTTKCLLSLLVATLLLLSKVKSLTKSPLSADTNTYMQLRSTSFDPSPYLNTNNSILNPKIFSISFNNAQNNINYQVALSISQINYVIPPSKGLNYSLNVGNKSTTVAQILLYTNNANNITFLTMNALFIKSGISIGVVYQLMAINTTMAPRQAFSKLWNYNTSLPANNQIYQSIIGIDGVAGDNLDIGFSADVALVNQTYFNFTITSNSNTMVYLNTIYVMVIACPDPILVADNTIIYMELQKPFAYLPSHPALLFQYFNDRANTLNVFAGLNGFQIRNGPAYNYMIAVRPGSSVDFYSQQNLIRFSFNIIVINYLMCFTTTPYLLVAAKTCYDICPPYYFSNKANLQCIPCPQNCQYCQLSSSNNMTCMPCPTGYQLSSTLTNSTCVHVCGDGITIAPQACDNGNITGKGCSINCTIQKSFYCTIQGVTSICNNCLPNCDYCSNPSTCNGCSPNFTLAISNSKCSFNCNITSDCKSCAYRSIVNGSAVDPYCITCQLGYQMLPGSTTCSSICRDGIYAPPEQCDQGASYGSGCSYSCTIMPGYYCVSSYPNISRCWACPAYCGTCTSNTTCTSCLSGYQFYNLTNGGILINICVLKCSSIYQCQACDHVNYTTVCRTCTLGYYPNNTLNSCRFVCGDGIRVGEEQCDDRNTINGDGCSSTCIIESAYYCSNVIGNVSICSPCMANCVSCRIATYCLLCQNNYIFFNNSCTRNCSIVINCNLCNANSPFLCSGCIAGYYVSDQICTSRCGDGIVVSGELCDDGNTVNGDGCSSNCTLEPYFYCYRQLTYVGTNPAATNRSICVRCISNCYDCSTNKDSCARCVTGYAINFIYSYPSCNYICTDYPNCNSCNPSYCLSCNSGYSIDEFFFCHPTCGDGNIIFPEQCDDGNTMDGDGCSSKCKIQNGFTCSQSYMSSVCSIVLQSITHQSVRKNPYSNHITMTYLILPIHPAFNSLYWHNVVQPLFRVSATTHTSLKLNSNDLIITNINYDSATGILSITMEYFQSVNNQQIQLIFSFPPYLPFSQIPVVNTTTSNLVSNNNLSMDVYSSQIYNSAIILENLSFTLAIIALIFFAVGYYNDKLVALQCVTVFQLAFFSLLTLDDLSPTFASLANIGISCGYSIKSMQDLPVDERRLRSLDFRLSFLQNYNLPALLIVLPLVASLPIYLINRFKYNLNNEKLSKYVQMLSGEIAFYGLMFSAYLIIVANGIEMKLYSSGASEAGLYIGILFLLIFVVYAFIMHRKPELLGIFTQKFSKQGFIQSHYYCLLILERALTVGALFLVVSNPQGSIIMVLIGTQIFMVLWFKPYQGERAWLRPFLNLVISALIQLVFILNQSISRSSYELYAPFAIIVCLAFTLAFNIYFYLKQLNILSCLTSKKDVDKYLEKDEQKFFNEDSYAIKQELVKEDLFRTILRKEAVTQERQRYGTVIKTAGLSLLDETAPIKQPEMRPDRKFNMIRDQLIKGRIGLAVDLPAETDLTFNWPEEDQI